MRVEKRMGKARNAAYAHQAALVAAVQRGAHPLRIAELTIRATRAWDAGAKLHRWRDASWTRVARWHRDALLHGVADAGAIVPSVYPQGIDDTWPDVPRGVQWLYRTGLPHYGAGPALLLDGTVVHPGNGVYTRANGMRV